MTAVTRDEANERLRVAAHEALEAHDMAEGVVTDLVVIVSQQYFDDEGIPHTQVAYLAPDAPPHYRLLGLIGYAATRLRTEIASAVSLEDEE